MPGMQMQLLFLFHTSISVANMGNEFEILDHAYGDVIDVFLYFCLRPIPFIPVHINTVIASATSCSSRAHDVTLWICC